MKHSKLLGLIALMLIGVYFASCSKEKEMSKMIPADRIVLNGTNSDLFYLDADSVELLKLFGAMDEKTKQIMLVQMRAVATI